MHKVKDAVTGHHDKETARGFKASDNVDDTPRDTYANPRTTGPSSGMGSDTYGSGPGSGYQTGTRPDFQRDENRNTGGRTNVGPHDSGLANKMDPRVDSDLDNRGNNAGNTDFQNTGGRTNAGPHDSKMANKMDPRVDSDLDNRGNNAGNTGFQNTGDSSYSSNPSNTAFTGQPRDANNMTSEESYSTSSREHQSHATTSQTTSGLDSGIGQQGFGGGGAAGGSSNDNNLGTRGQSGLQQGSDPLNKLDPRVRGSNEQQNAMGNQRGGY